MVKFSIPFFTALMAFALVGFPTAVRAQNGPTMLIGKEAALSAQTAQSEAASETLYVGLNKVELLSLTKSAGTIIISDPTVLDVRLESSKRLMLLGQKVGETGFVVMGRNGRQIIAVNVVVGPNSKNSVSIFRDCTGAEKGCAVEEEYSCSPRCVRVANPAEVVSTNANNGGGGGPIGGSGGTAAATAATTATTTAPTTTTATTSASTTSP